jgi:transcriptional regulator with XRE-family HTH domain
MDARALVGKNVRQLRSAAGLSQEELAARMDVGQGYVSGLEAGRRNPTLTTLSEIAMALNVSLSELFTAAPTASKRRAGRGRKS